MARQTIVHNQNILLRSDDLGNATWSKTNCTIATDQVANPINGAVDADAVTDSVDGGATTHSISQAYTSPPGNYTFSWFIKSINAQWIQLLGTGGGSALGFDLVNGVVSIIAPGNGPVIAARMVNYGNGWYRCILAYSQVSGVATNAQMRIGSSTNITSYTGTGNLRYYMWGAQLVQGISEGLYTPTTTVAINTGAPRISIGQGHNLLLMSESADDALWTKTNGTITANAVANPINGAVDADGFTDNSTAGATHSISQTPNLQLHRVYTFSVYAKAAAGGQWISLAGDAAGVFVNFDLLNGVVGTPYGSTATAAFISASMMAVPGAAGWYRCKITFLNEFVAAAACRVYTAVATGSVTYSGSTTLMCYLWGMQLSCSNQVGPYVKTTSVVADTGQVRNPLTSNGQNLGQNLILQSETLATTWGTTNASVTSNSVANPLDGAVTADSLVDTGANATHVLNQAAPSSLIIGQPYTISIYAKAANRNWLILTLSTGAIGAYFNVSTGAIGAAGGGATAWNVQCVSAGNGWYRCSFTALAPSTVASMSMYAANADATSTYAGSSNEALYLYGAQIVLGQSPGVYVPTTTAVINNWIVPGRVLVSGRVAI